MISPLNEISNPYCPSNIWNIEIMKILKITCDFLGRLKFRIPAMKKHRIWNLEGQQHINVKIQILEILVRNTYEKIGHEFGVGDPNFFFLCVVLEGFFFFPLYLKIRILYMLVSIENKKLFFSLVWNFYITQMDSKFKNWRTHFLGVCLARNLDFCGCPSNIWESKCSGLFKQTNPLNAIEVWPN